MLKNVLEAAQKVDSPIRLAAFAVALIFLAAILFFKKDDIRFKSFAYLVLVFSLLWVVGLAFPGVKKDDSKIVGKNDVSPPKDPDNLDRKPLKPGALSATLGVDDDLIVFPGEEQGGEPSKQDGPNGLHLDTLSSSVVDGHLIMVGEIHNGFSHELKRADHSLDLFSNPEQNQKYFLRHITLHFGKLATKQKRYFRVDLGTAKSFQITSINSWN